MSKETKTPKHFKLNTKNKIFKTFNFTKQQSLKTEQYLKEIYAYNAHTNIVGRSTLVDPWNIHILDSIQIKKFIKNKKSSILDLGTGAGIPGMILAINNFTNVSLIDSNFKKIVFVNKVSIKLNIKVRIYHQRIESLLNKKFDYLVSRALTNLNKLFFLSQKFLKKDSILVLLKGKKIKEEISVAKKKWDFTYEIHQSKSDKTGKIIVIKNLKNLYE